MTSLSYEWTLSLLKPDATRRNITGAIVQMMEESGLILIAQRRLRLTKEEAAAFYKIHAHRPFFDELCTIMSSGPIVAQILQGENAIDSYRLLMGDTDPSKATKETIRGKFGLSISENTVHGSDSSESALEEIPFFFHKLEILPA